jgi:hypothetical protein
MRWFGQRYRAPVYRDVERMTTPVGVACGHCDELFVEGDDGFAMPFLTGDGTALPAHASFHRECHLRQVLGSVAHIQKLCSCYVPGADEGDPVGMTKREAARAAVREYERLERVPLT